MREVFLKLPVKGLQGKCFPFGGLCVLGDEWKNDYFSPVTST